MKTLLIALAGAAAARRPVRPARAPADRPARKNFKYGTGDGQTMATAVEIRTRSESDGGVMIKDWIRANYPGFTIHRAGAHRAARQGLQHDHHHRAEQHLAPRVLRHLDVLPPHRQPRTSRSRIPDAWNCAPTTSRCCCGCWPRSAPARCIGYERSFHGRPAGLRTHVLVCLASSVLMLVTVYEDHWVRIAGEARLDPTRMAQGIMTGIGFLGAGVIVKEGLNVRGLTTAASIWITAAIGVLAGVGLVSCRWSFAVMLTLLVLSVFRWIEMRVPTQAYYYFDVKYAREGNLSEEGMRELLEQARLQRRQFQLPARRRRQRAQPASQDDAADHRPRRGVAPGALARGKPDRARIPAVTRR